MLGPVWSSDYSASVGIVKKLLDGSLSACPDISFGVVDVRDIADLHVRALAAPNMAGERFIASGPFFKLRAIAADLRAQIGAEAHKVTTRKLPDLPGCLMALFNPHAKAVLSAKPGCIARQGGARLGHAADATDHRRYGAKLDQAVDREGLKLSGSSDAQMSGEGIQPAAPTPLFER